MQLPIACNQQARSIRVPLHTSYATVHFGGNGLSLINVRGGHGVGVTRRIRRNVSGWKRRDLRERSCRHICRPYIKKRHAAIIPQECNDAAVR
jgi:hypothetical protein